MNIYALKGHTVRCHTLNAGYNSDIEQAKKYLTINKEYTVEKTDVYNWNTNVVLQDFPDVMFNSVFFDDVEEQPEEKDKQHKDYHKY